MEPLTEQCPICRREVDRQTMTGSADIDESLHPLLAVNQHTREPGMQICSNCIRRYSKLHDELFAAFPQFAQQELKVIPTPMRLDAPAEFRGRGVTIAFLDSGFYAHPDLSKPRDRILNYLTLPQRAKSDDLTSPQVSS